MNAQLTANPRGRYRFLSGIEPYSSGVVAEPGWEIVHATLAHPLPWSEGLHLVRRHLENSGRERHALCAVELRCPQPFSMDGFKTFNKQYRSLLEEWDMLVDGENPIARTNVSPVFDPPTESCLYGFSYTRPQESERHTFVIAGGGELRSSHLDEQQIVRVGETSEDALTEKARCVVEIMRSRLDGLGVSDSLLSTIDVYTAHPLHRLLEEVVIPAFPAAAHLGVRWFDSHPPVCDIEFEMDMRGVSHDIMVDLRLPQNP